jgi:hypothetical protein
MFKYDTEHKGCKKNEYKNIKRTRKYGIVKQKRWETFFIYFWFKWEKYEWIKSEEKINGAK